MPKRERLAGVLLLVAAFVPLLLFLYIGTFTRLMTDDYLYLGKAREVGAWQSMLYWRETWTGEYTSHLAYGLLEPMGEALPPLSLIFLAAIALPGFAFAAHRMMRHLGAEQPRAFIVFSLAALMLGASFNGFLSVHNLYWLTSVLEYSSPLPLLLTISALLIFLGGTLAKKLPFALCALALAGIAFLTAGFSEMYCVFQTVILALLLLSLIALFLLNKAQKSAKHRRFIALSAASFLGSLIGLAVHLAAPGVHYRANLPDNFGNTMNPIRDLPALIEGTVVEMVGILGHPPAFAGFMLVMAAGACVALCINSAPPPPSDHNGKLIKPAAFGGG